MVRETAFRQQMAFLRNNFDCLSIEESLNRRHKRPKNPGVVVTFDDGYANNLEVALPILVEYEIPAVIYICTQHVLERRLFWPDVIWMAAKSSGVTSINLRGISSSLGFYPLSGDAKSWQNAVLKILQDLKKIDPQQRENLLEAIVTRLKMSPDARQFDLQVESNVFTPLTPEQVRILASESLITIGAHSHCHNLLDRIPSLQAEESIRKSKEILEQLTGGKVEHFSYPNGNFNTDLASIVQDVGYRSAVTLQPGFFRMGDNPFTINRITVGANTSIDLFKALLMGSFELTKRFDHD